jgi:single-stranded DNA-specific DHH superfamily exonuclease
MQFPVEKEWKIAEIIPEGVKAALHTYSPIMAQLLYNRGIKDLESADSFLNGKNSFHDPFLLKDMQKAIDLILLSIEEGEKIAVFGDYDVDGITATVLLTQVLQKMGANAIPYIPDRFTEGYGVNVIALDILQKKGVNLIITVDCGIRSPNELEYAIHKLDMKVIISDHHMPEEFLPIVDAIICQKQAGDEYPEKNLSGAGLAFKIAEALLKTKPFPGVLINDYLELCALGTVADVVPLLGENRSIVRQGLINLKTTRRLGLSSLMGVARINVNTLSTTDISFGIAPRLNAAGRILSNHINSVPTLPVFNEGKLLNPQIERQVMAAVEIIDSAVSASQNRPKKEEAIVNEGDVDGIFVNSNLEALSSSEIVSSSAPKPAQEETQKALMLLMAEDIDTAARLAQELDDLNRQRQNMTREMQSKAEAQVNQDVLLLFMRDEDFNPGLVGLVASKLTEVYYRPTIIGYKGKKNTRASCRSIAEFHITNALDRCKDLLLQHGGHAMAAGFTVENERWDELMQRLMLIADENLDHGRIKPKISVDLDIPLRDLPQNILVELDRLEPLGADNPPALFVSRNVQVIERRTVGQAANHLKLKVRDGRVYYDGIAFNQGGWAQKLLEGIEIDILYQVERNIYQGKISTQLNIKDIKLSKSD